MRRVFRGPRRLRYFCAASLIGLLLAGLPLNRPRPWFVHHSSSPISRVWFDFIVTLLIVLIAFLVVEVFRPRVIADEEGLILFRFGWPHRRRIGRSEIERYVYGGRKQWALLVDGKTITPEIDFELLHVWMFRHARKALAPKRLKFTQLPPSQDFIDLPMLDPSSWYTLVVPSLFVGLFIWSPPAIVWGARSFSDAWAAMRFAFASLSVTSEGVRETWPFRQRTMSWDQVRAVFCENKVPNRVFILVGDELSIEIPRHLACDAELMRKVFYSLPESTLFVNFDESSRRGYGSRRRVRRQAPATGELVGVPG